MSPLLELRGTTQPPTPGLANDAEDVSTRPFRLPLLAAGGFAVARLFSQRLRILTGVPRNRFLCGRWMAVAFVALRLLPAMAYGGFLLVF